MGRSLALAGFLTLLSANARASGDLAIDAWLQKPGVKLLAVEFYATWCKPCMEAVPKWKALHDKYKKRGLRLVVVATQDPQAGCGSPGWAPDDLVCDLEGTVAERFGAKNLPSAFLWGWQGHQLVGKGHVEDVEAAIESWMREAPRVEVEVGEVAKGVKLGKDELRRLVLDELNRQDKLVVVASAAERKKLAELRKRSFEAGFDEQLQCEVGKELSANSLLEASVVGDAKRPRLSLQLRSVETGCLSASAVVDLDADRVASSLAEAMATLVNRTRTETQLPGGSARKRAAPKAVATQPIEEQPSDWAPEASAEVLVSFSSTPAGAVVSVDGELLCQATPCKKALARGAHSVVMQKERYEKRLERVTAEANLELDWRLEAGFGWLSVSSEPPGLPVLVDGTEVGKTPLQDHELDPGPHEVFVADRCYLKKGERFGLAKAEKKKLSLSPAARQSAVDVKAEDAEGNAVEATVSVDGLKLGLAPGTWKLPLCSAKLEVSSQEHGTFEQDLALEERKTAKVKAVLGASAGMVRIPGGRFFMGCNEEVDSECAADEKPGRPESVAAFRMDRTEVTVEAYAACVKAGTCSSRGLEMPFYGGKDQPEFARFCTWGKSGRGRHPITCVDWDQAAAYCRWAKKRLPTEKEWERAARGTDGRKYPWGNEGFGREPVANIADEQAKREYAGWATASGYDDGYVGTSPVGSFPAGRSPEGLDDMIGNVWEWTADGYGSGKTRSNRGGSWFNPPASARASGRGWGVPAVRVDDLGFRCAESD